MGEQFRLSFPQPVPPLESLLYGADGRASLKVLRQWRDWPKRYVALTGPGRSGVSTVLRSWAREVEGRYLAPEDWMDKGPQDLSDLLEAPLALDDVDTVQPSSALLTLINLATEKSASLVLGGHGSPQLWHQSPPDLVSRLSAVTTVHLPALDETNLARRLRAACLRRFIDLPDETLSFLTKRISPSFEAVETFAQLLDTMMSETQRPPTIPLARDVLATLEELNDQRSETDDAR